MGTNQSVGAAQVRAAVNEALHHHRVLFLFEGTLLVILGLLSILVPAVASLAATVFFGWILLLSGVVGLVSTIRGSATQLDLVAGAGAARLGTGLNAERFLLTLPAEGSAVFVGR